jgi:hypothetical protein
MSLFRILFLIDAATALIVLCFFFIGLSDGSVSSFNMSLWLGILAGIAAILAGGYLLQANGNPRLANLVLALLAIPALLYGAFILLIVIAQPRWN